MSNDFDFNDSFGDFDDFDDFDEGGLDTSNGVRPVTNFDEFDGDDEDDFDFSGGSSGTSTEGADFSGAFDVEPEANTTSAGPQKDLKKIAIITVCSGVALLIVVAVIIGLIKKSEAKKELVNTTYQKQVTVDENVDNIMSYNRPQQKQQVQQTQVQPQSPSVSYTKQENGMNWVEITDHEDIQFNQDYTSMMFTVTNIKHYARSVDTNNNLVMKTTLSGSVSGLSGTYTIDVPYNKGVKLKVGNSFTVNVQLGTYNGKTVVGEISY